MRASQWTPGALSTTVVPTSALRALGGRAGGPAIVKSNNPERFFGDGWLVTTGPGAATRGGTAVGLRDTALVYLFHINAAGPRTLSLVVTNPGTAPVTLSARGSMYTNSEKPLGVRSGQSYAVALDWLTGTLRTRLPSRTIPATSSVVVAKASTGYGGMTDGRFELVSSAPVYVTTVVTSGSTDDEAILTAGGRFAPGEFASTNAGDYGREAGVYASSRWSGSMLIDVPAAAAAVGLALNTTGRADATGVSTQDQTSPATSRLTDSVARTNGNYGHEYDITLNLRNPTDAPRTVRLSFASNVTGTTDTPSFTFNGPMLVGDSLRTVYTKPTAPKQLIATRTVAPAQTLPVRVRFFVPGLITTNAQFILETP